MINENSERFLEKLSQAQIQSLLQTLDADLARVSLYEFFCQAWPIIDPSTALIPNWHLQAICEHLEAVIHGDILRLVINIPPGHCKSNLVAVAFPAWVWTFRPQWRALFSSYSADLAQRDSVRTRDVLQSEWYRRNFCPDWRLKDDVNTKSFFSNTLSGFRMALSVGSKATGFRGNAVIVDDPLNARDMRSETKRDDCISWWDKSMSTRLNDQRKDALIVVMQRLHNDDLTGHLKRVGGYQVLQLPSEFETKSRSVTYVRTGEKFWEDSRTREGELLFPQLFPEDVLSQAKITLGSDGYAGQHQQRPTPVEGGLFKKSYWRFWKPDGTAPDYSAERPEGCFKGQAIPLPKLDQIILSLDASFKDLAHNDFVCFFVIGVHKANKFLLARRYGRMSFTKTLQVFRELSTSFPYAKKKLVEDKANGSAIIDTLKGELSGVIAIEPHGGKEARASAIQAEVESGNVYLPDGAPWIDEFIQELADFPNGTYDDQVDALSQGLIYLADSPSMFRAIAMSRM